MKILKAINSYKELIILTFVVIYLIIKRFPTSLIISGTISLGICLFVLKYFTYRQISKNKALMESYSVKKETFDEIKTDSSSSSIDESRFKEEIRVLKEVIVYAESCNQYYNYQSSEAESFIDERCKPFIDLVAPLLTVCPNEYQLVIRLRPSLEPYVHKKIKEYNENRPALIDIKTEAQKLLKLNFNQYNTKSDFNFTTVSCAILMVEKYGFSQELLSVAKGLNTELYNGIIRTYDQKLRGIENYYDFYYECYKDPENAMKLR